VFNLHSRKKKPPGSPVGNGGITLRIEILTTGTPPTSGELTKYEIPLQPAFLQLEFPHFLV
jgi:hypothetical protein